MDTSLKSEETGPTFEECVDLVMNTRRVDVPSKARETVISEMGIKWASAAYVLMSAKVNEVSFGRETGKTLVDGIKYFEDNGFGRVFKITRTRLQFEASAEFLDTLLKHPYIKEDDLHRNSYIVPVGCLGWILLLTIRGDIVTLDHLPRQIPVSHTIFVRRALVEPIRRILRSRNAFTSIPGAPCKFNLRLQKSSLSLGALDHFKSDLTAAIKERLQSHWEIFYHDDYNNFSFTVEEKAFGRWHREFKITGQWTPLSDPLILATIKVIDKTLFLEI